MRRTDRTKSDRKYLKANILGFSLKIHKTRTILLSIMIFITLTGLALAKVYNMKQSQNITDKATTRKITQQETSTRKKASSTQIELPEETDTKANEEEYEKKSDKTVESIYETQESVQHAEQPNAPNETISQAQKVKTKGNFTNQGEIILAPQIVPGMVQTYIDAGRDVPTFIDSHTGFRVFQLERASVLVETTYVTEEGGEHIKDQIEKGELVECQDMDHGIVYFVTK